MNYWTHSNTSFSNPFCRCCPVDCTTSNWGAWGACNAACDKMGKQTRTRTITRSPSCNGKACGSLTSEKSCSGPCCPKDCVLSSWSAWGKCNAPSGKCPFFSYLRFSHALNVPCSGYSNLLTTSCQPVIFTY